MQGWAVTVNDPHVESLHYRLRTSEGLNFTNPPPLHHDEGRIRCRLEKGHLTVEMKEHHASVASAREVVRPFLENWEIAEAIRRGRREMWFEYIEGAAKIIDRSPPTPSPPGASQEICPATFDSMIVILGDVARVVRGEGTYPPPPAGFVASQDVKTLFAEYQKYTEGRDLARMAFACYRYVTEKLAHGEPEAAKKFNISRRVLGELGHWAGGKGRRKDLTQEPYTPQEEEWVATAVRILIRRVGEHAAGGTLNLITMADLPKLRG